jgi:TPR repeat protein
MKSAGRGPIDFECARIRPKELLCKLFGACEDNNGIYSAIGDIGELISRIETEAGEGDESSQIKLANYKLLGVGADKKEEEAIRILKEISSHGNPYATVILGACYYFGKGVTLNLPKAREYFQQAIEKEGLMVARHLLAVSYLHDIEATPAELTIAILHLSTAASSGDAESQYSLGLCYERGTGVTGNITEACKWYEEAASQVHQKALMQLMLLSLSEKDVGKGTQHVIDFLRTFADINIMPAQSLLGLLLVDCFEYAGLPTISEGVRYLELAAEAGDALSQYSLGAMYANGKLVPLDYARALKMFNLSAEQHYTDAFNSLGTCYLYGQGVERDFKKSFQYFKLAADKGHARARLALAQMYKSGFGTAVNMKETVRLLTLSAADGNSIAQSSLGTMYMMGEGVAKDMEKGFTFWQTAALQDDPTAQQGLGLAYEHGMFVSKNMKKAMEWYRLAADQGLRDSQFFLASIYASEQAGVKDMKQAIKYYKMAAAQGHADAQDCVGLCYRDGRGVGKDETKAQRYFEMARETRKANPLWKVIR